MNITRRILLSALLLLAAACAPNPAADGARQGDTIIAREEIDRAGAATAFDLVRSARPQWLRTRGANSIRGDEGIIIYLDNARMGPVESLRQIEIANVGAVRFYDAAAANYRFGPGHRSGVIQVSTRD